MWKTRKRPQSTERDPIRLSGTNSVKIVSSSISPRERNASSVERRNLSPPAPNRVKPYARLATKIARPAPASNVEGKIKLSKGMAGVVGATCVGGASPIKFAWLWRPCREET